MYGIEAARTVIVKEIAGVFGAYGNMHFNSVFIVSFWFEDLDLETCLW